MAQTLNPNSNQVNLEELIRRIEALEKELDSVYRELEELYHELHHIETLNRALEEENLSLRAKLHDMELEIMSLRSRCREGRW